VDAAKSGDQEVRVGEVFVECAEKIGFPGFGFFRQSNNYALRGRKRLPEEKMQLTGSRDQRMAAGSILTVLESPKWKSRSTTSGWLASTRTLRCCGIREEWL
jgi:hypothetical protein